MSYRLELKEPLQCHTIYECTMSHQTGRELFSTVNFCKKQSVNLDLKLLRLLLVFVLWQSIERRTSHIKKPTYVNVRWFFVQNAYFLLML